MRIIRTVEDSEEARARARLLAHFEDHQESVFYSRQLEVLFEREYFHWVTNRALRRLVEEGRINVEARTLDIGSEVKLLWHRKYRFYRRTASEVYDLVNRYSSAAGDGTLGLQGEHLVLAAFARARYLLVGEATRGHQGRVWTETGHNLDFIFEKDGVSYGIEVKNTLGYLDLEEFVIKVRLCRHLGLKPVFAVRSLPKTWIDALIHAGGYAMIMGYQFYPWTHTELATEIREKLLLPVDTPKRIEAGTIQRFEKWVAQPKVIEGTTGRVERLLARFESSRGDLPREPEGL
jgi:hypothetical protein